jgi:hypothetical protein
MLPVLASLIAQVSPRKPSRDGRLFNMAMRAVLFVAVAGVVGTMIVFAYTAEWHGRIGSDNGAEPNVQLSSAYSWGGNEWEVDVAGVSESTDLEDWRAILRKDGNIEDDLDPLSDGFSFTTFFVDLDGGGQLTTGDFFVITCDPGSDYELTMVWKPSGNARGSVSWSA